MKIQLTPISHNIMTTCLIRCRPMSESRRQQLMTTRTPLDLWWCAVVSGIKTMAADPLGLGSCEAETPWIRLGCLEPPTFAGLDLEEQVLQVLGALTWSSGHHILLLLKMVTSLFACPFSLASNTNCRDKRFTCSLKKIFPAYWYQWCARRPSLYFCIDPTPFDHLFPVLLCFLLAFSQQFKCIICWTEIDTCWQCASILEML